MPTHRDQQEMVCTADEMMEGRGEEAEEEEGGVHVQGGQ